MKTLQITCALSAALLLAACQDEAASTVQDPIRSVVAHEVQSVSPLRTRAFPAVLQPPEITPLAFDIGGRLGPLALRIGQAVEAGDVLATVAAEDATLRLQQAEAALAEAQAAANNARSVADRQQSLFDRNVVAAAARDDAAARAQQADARVMQARRSLDLLEESLGDTTLRAPFDAVVDGITVQAFASVQPGQPIVTLYEDNALQATIYVSYDVVSRIELGQRVSMSPADGAERSLAASITEIGQRAAAVSSFPIVISLDDEHPDLRSGMAVEVSLWTCHGFVPCP
ncbi:MAG: efflux RND transporter periplasmic adaptor subunit [Hyphomicrobiales bacterium]|jgi:RND family efflux transporter MFP subunit